MARSKVQELGLAKYVGGQWSAEREAQQEISSRRQKGQQGLTPRQARANYLAEAEAAGQGDEE
jgi:hypothetical protein